MRKPEWMTQEMADRLVNDPQAAASVAGWAASIARHNRDPLYGNTRQYFEKKQREQIAKGAEKYPESLGRSAWSMAELADHAMEELVDQAHYITALKTTADGIAKRLEEATKMQMALTLIGGVAKSMARDASKDWAIRVSEIIDLTQGYASQKWEIVEKEPAE
jgi:hypothetical protein